MAESNKMVTGFIDAYNYKLAAFVFFVSERFHELGDRVLRPCRQSVEIVNYDYSNVVHGRQSFYERYIFWLSAR